ncbi:MAG: 8-oxo-dGTP diphosphatase MutT [Planctomycetes bacterium]|nr:8-oxo-dGTP diphosphatase MutT [Planctomycetota bacterium]
MSQKRVKVAIGVLAEKGREGWRILIARRPETAVLGGYWEMPGGKIESGETAEQCLAREFREELGLAVRVGEALKVIEHHYDHAHVTLHPFFCERLGGEPSNLQVAEHRWVSPGKLAGYRFPEANGPLITEVLERLAGDAG